MFNRNMTVLKTFILSSTYTLLEQRCQISKTCTAAMNKVNYIIPNNGFSTYSVFFTNRYDIVKRSAIYVQVRFKSMKRHLDYTKVPKLNETDLEEQFIRGSGPGGQATNKTSNAVHLKHKPTGIIVKCHETRSLWTNKERAREIMTTKLDSLLNGEDSIESQQIRLMKKALSEKIRKKNKLSLLKKRFKEREGLE